MIDAPHDFIIGGTYDQSDPASGSSYLPRFDGIYRKHFNLPADWKGSSVWLKFDGVFHTTKIYLNGQGFGSHCHSCGYTSFTLRLDNQTSIKFGDGKANENVIAMFVDGSKGTGWWYEGAGLYRHVHLIKADHTHIDNDGIFAPATVTGAISSGTTPTDGHTADATVHASATIVTDAAAPASAATATAAASVSFSLYDATSGEQIGASVPGVAAAGSTSVYTADIPVKGAKLWSIPRPHLYSLSTTVSSSGAAGSTSAGAVLDSLNTTVGIRTLNYTGDDGFFMNGKHVKVRGFWCVGRAPP